MSFFEFYKEKIIPFAACIVVLMINFSNINIYEIFYHPYTKIFFIFYIAEACSVIY